MQAEVSNTAEKKKKSPIRFVILAAILLLGGYFGYTKYQFATTHETTDNAQVETQFVPVLPRVSGYIKTLNVKDYDSVKIGDLLVELDDAEMQLQLQQMEADYRQAAVDIASAQANLSSTSAALQTNRGNITLANIKKQKATQDLKRDNNLLQQEAITKKQFEDSRFNSEAAAQQLQNAETDLTSAQTKLSVLKTNVTKASSILDVKKALIDQQKLKLSYTKIYAPQGGKIGKKNISNGQYVQAGTPLFTVVNDSIFWIIANFKENQIQKMNEGMEVDVKLDAYPDLNIKGNIESLSDATGAKFALLPADNASGNFVKVSQRIPVKIAIKNIAAIKNLLRAGLSATVIVPVSK
jgi:membrane fusion protein, multidrug efflux system